MRAVSQHRRSSTLDPVLSQSFPISYPPTLNTFCVSLRFCNLKRRRYETSLLLFGKKKKKERKIHSELLVSRIIPQIRNCIICNRCRSFFLSKLVQIHLLKRQSSAIKTPRRCVRIILFFLPSKAWWTTSKGKPRKNSTRSFATGKFLFCECAMLHPAIERSPSRRICFSHRARFCLIRYLSTDCLREIYWHVIAKALFHPVGFNSSRRFNALI